MRNSIVLSTAVTTFFIASAFLCQALPVLERFDPGRPVAGNIIGHGTLAPGEGMESGALKAYGSGKLETFYRYSLQTQAGHTYALAFNYRTSPQVKSNLLYVRIKFFSSPGARPVQTIEKRLRAVPHWTHNRIEFTVPENIVETEVELLTDPRVPSDGFVWFDFLRIAEVKDGKAAGIDIETFDTDFENWAFDRHLIFDHFNLKDGGSVVTEWRKAKFGEAFFQAVGNQSPMQYALMIENIKVAPQTNYAFSCWINTSAAFATRISNIFIFFYKDKNFKNIGESRLYPASPQKDQWREVTHCFTTPEQCEYIDIGLNLRNVGPQDQFLMDRIRFHRVADKAMLDFSIDPDKRKLSAKIILTGDLQKNSSRQSELIVCGADKKEFRRIVSDRLSEEIDLGDFPDGEYTLQAKIKLPDGRILSAGPRKFGVYQHPSWRNNLGIQNAAMPAPAPWKNLKFSNQTVFTWQPEIKFAQDTLQLQNISADKHPLLLEPMKFLCNGKELLNAVRPVKWDVKPSCISGMGVTENEDWSCAVRSDIDYTGFVKYTLDFQAKRPTVLHSGALLLKVKNAEFLHRCDYSWTNVGAIVFAEHPNYTAKQVYTDLQMGSVDRGVCVYLPQVSPARRMLPQDYLFADKTGKLEIHFINQALKLQPGEFHRIEFAVCAYPFRPAQELWRKLFFRAGKYRNLDLVWGITLPMMKHSGSTMAIADAAAAREHLNAPNRPKRYLMYQIPTYILDNMPEWTYFEKYWRNPQGSYYDLSQSHGGMLAAADYRDRNWQDFYCKIMAESLKQYPWDGVYYDCFSADWFSERGNLFSPVFDCRKFQERIYNTQRLERPDSLTISHLGAAQAATLGAYSNIILMGEQYRSMLMNYAYYLDFMSLDQFRYENAVKVGPDRMFMPEYRKVEYQNDSVLTVHTGMLALLHNLMFYPNSVSFPVEQRIRNRKIEFGLTDVSFLPYWEKKAADRIASNQPNVKISVFEKRNGDLLAAVFNTVKEPIEFSLYISGDVARADFYDPLTDQTSHWHRNAVFRLEPYLGAIVTVKRKASK